MSLPDLGRTLTGGLIPGVFGGKSAPSPQPKPLPQNPVVDPDAVAAQQRKAAEEQMRAAGGGRASTLLTGPSGDTLGQSSVSKMLTGL